MNVANYEITCVFDIEGLAPFADDWNAALEKVHHPIPLKSHAAITSFAKHLLQPGESFCCLIATKNGRFSGALPLVISRVSEWGCRRTILSVVRHPHMVQVDLVTNSDDTVNIRRALIESCYKFFPGFTRLELNHISADSSTIDAVTSERTEKHLAMQPQGHSTYFDTSIPIELYFAQLSGKFNRDMRRNIKQFFNLPDARIDFLRGNEVTDAAFESFLDLEGRGWKAAHGDAIVQNPHLCAFYRSIVSDFRRLGWMEIHLAYVESRVVAVQVVAKIGNVLYPLKVAYDERLAKYAPGKVLIARTIERAFADDATDKIDSLGESSWIHQWSQNKRDLVKLSLYPNPIYCLLHGRMRPRVRTWLKRLPFVSDLVARPKR